MSTNANKMSKLGEQFLQSGIPLVHAFIDERGGKISVNGDCYLKLLQDRFGHFFDHTQHHSAQWGWPLSETFFREDFLAAQLTCRDRR